MGQSNELDQEPTGEVAKWEGDQELTPGILPSVEAVDTPPDFQGMAEELEALKDKHGEVCVRENNLVRKIEAIRDAVMSHGGLVEKWDRVLNALNA